MLRDGIMTEGTAYLAATTHMLCRSGGMYFSAAASSEKIPDYFH
jgi:hypothetical protein